MKDCSWEIRHEAGEYVIGNENGVLKASPIRRRPDDEKWNKDKLNELNGLPWQPTPGVKSVEVRSRVEHQMNL